MFKVPINILSLLIVLYIYLRTVAWAQATHKETTPSVQNNMLKSGKIFSEATMVHGPTRSMIKEEEEAYRRSFARHVASRSNQVCSDSVPIRSPRTLLHILTNLLRHAGFLLVPPLRLICFISYGIAEMLIPPGNIGEHPGTSCGRAP